MYSLQFNLCKDELGREFSTPKQFYTTENYVGNLSSNIDTFVKPSLD